MESIIRNLRISESIMWKTSEISNMYKEYIDRLGNLSSKELKIFLEMIKQNETIATQTMENQNPALVQFYSLMQRKDAIDFAKEVFRHNPTLQDISDLHSHIIENTEIDMPQNYGYRDGSDTDDDYKWVGSFINNERCVDYYPPTSNLVEPSMIEILNYLNQTIDEETFEKSLIKAFIVHASIVILQPFRDGNTRTARLIQYAYIWKKTKHFFDVKLSSPILYLSQNYKIYRGQYREKIRNIAVMQNEMSWPKWIDFNLNMIHEQLYKREHDLNDIAKTKVR